jgi:hypothetical protein
MIFKSIKKAFAWTSILLFLLVLLVGGGYLALRSPKVQTKLTQVIAGYLSEELQTTVSVNGVDIGFFNRVILEGLYVEDQKSDTLAYLSRLHLGVRYVSIDDQAVHLSKVRIDDLKFYLHKYEGDEKLNLQFLIDYFSVPKDTAVSKPWDIRSSALELRNAAFQLQNDYAENKAVGIDYKHLDITRINLLIDDIRVDGDTIFGDVRKLSCFENRGFLLKNLSGLAKVSPMELKVNDLKIATATSELDLDLHYTYSDWKDYLTFVDSVRMDYVFQESKVDLKDVAFFAPALEGLDQKLDIKGSVYGPVSGLNARNLEIGYGTNTKLVGNVDIDGLPDINESFIFLDLKSLTTTYQDLKTIPKPPFKEGEKINVPSNISNLGKVKFQGAFTGFINDFVAFGNVKTSIGSITTDIAIKQGQTSVDLAYSGALQSYAFDVGKFVNDDRLGPVSLNVEVVGSGIAIDNINANLIGEVKSARLIGYDYKDIEVNGEFARSMFTGEVAVNDTNLSLIFRGGFDLSQELPEFNFYSDIRHANLYELNLLRDRQNATVSGVMEVDFIGDDIDNLVGWIELTNATYKQEDDPLFEVDRFSLNVSEGETQKHLELRSGILDADFDGTFKFREIKTAANNLLRKHLPSYAGSYQAMNDSSGLDFSFNMNLKNTELITYLFAEQLVIGDSSNFNGNYSSARNEVYLRGRLNEVQYNSVTFNDVRIAAENPGKEFELGVAVGKLSLTDSLFLKSFNLRSFTFKDSLGLLVEWDNKTKLENKALIRGIASFPKNEAVSFHLDRSSLSVAGLEWSVSAENLLTIDSSTFNFTDFRFHSENQTIAIDGAISKDPNAKLNINLNKFDLSNFNVLTQRRGLTLEGNVSGNAKISGIYDKLFLTNQLSVNSLVLNDIVIGTGEFNNTWIPSTRSVQVFGLLSKGDTNTVSIVGEFLPGEDRQQNFNIKAMVERLPLSVFDPYIDKVLTDVKGTAKANLSLKGKLDSPELNGYVVLDKADFLFTYLNTRFNVSDTVQVKKDGFYFNELNVFDEEGSPGVVNGWVKHKGFKNFSFDAQLNAVNFKALNTNSAMNSLYYGKAFGTGNVRFSGKPKSMQLDVSMRTDRGTRFNIPLYGAKNVNETDFITFVKPKGQEVEKIEVDEEFKVSFQDLVLNMDIEVTTDAEIQLIFDPAVGDIIKGRGDGDISMNLDRDGSFKMFGDYYINKGEYLFTLQNIINKKFLIDQGGTINWSGNPYQAFIDITARYGVRTSLYDLMFPDTSDTYRRRIQVDCILKMTDNLLNPNIAFDIDLPNSDETIKTEVRNKIGVGNDQEMNRQVFGLLVLNRFFPTENQNQELQQAGGFFSSSTSEMISNQLSNWLSKISNDFDVGLNYRPGDDITGDELQVALSTQLFNNRIIIDGNVGVANTQSSSSNIVGDVNIEYKITADGRFRVRAFNESNDINALVDNAPFTQGVGLSYQKEFDRVVDLFRRRKKKDYMKE